MRESSQSKASSMQIGWREFIKARFKKASKFHSIGIGLGVDSVHLSVLKKINGELVWVKQHAMPIKAWQKELKRFIRKNNLINTQCDLSLSIAKYQLMQLDKPGVEETELRSALQWTVKEQLSSDEELVVDYFEHPATINTDKLNVVAVPKREVIDIRNGILAAGLVLQSIGVEELAACNLFPASDDAIISLRQEASGQLCLTIVKQKMLFFSRRLKGYENLASFSPEELKMGVADNLSLDIQRSMDYFESQLRQAPVKRVYLSLDTLHQQTLAEMIKDVIYVPVEKFSPDITKKSNLSSSPFSFVSLGAALGNTSVQV